MPILQGLARGLRALTPSAVAEFFTQATPPAVTVGRVLLVPRRMRLAVAVREQTMVPKRGLRLVPVRARLHVPARRPLSAPEG